MSAPHVIRLRGPWTYEPLAHLVRCKDGTLLVQRQEALPPGKLDLPADWGQALGVGYRGRVRFRRPFHAPTGLDACDRVWLVVAGADACGHVVVNGVPLGEVAGYALPVEFEITGLLRPFSEVVVEVDLPDIEPGGAPPVRPGREQLPGGLVGEVRLEIRGRQFIDGLSLWIAATHVVPTLEVRGSISGETHDGPLSVVISAFQREVWRSAASVGQAIHASVELQELQQLESAEPDRRADFPVEVRLIAGGAAIWRAQRRTAARRIAWQVDTTTLTVRGQPVAWPAQRLADVDILHAVSSADHGLSEHSSGTIWASDRIQAEDEYLLLDACGMQLIQAVPREWASIVAPRLAHHPSIVAWMPCDGEGSMVGFADSRDVACGRPWLPRNIVLG